VVREEVDGDVAVVGVQHRTPCGRGRFSHPSTLPPIGRARPTPRLTRVTHRGAQGLAGSARQSIVFLTGSSSDGVPQRESPQGDRGG
jgi:hypothetical protein